MLVFLLLSDIFSQSLSKSPLELGMWLSLYLAAIIHGVAFLSTSSDKPAQRMNMYPFFIPGRPKDASFSQGLPAEFPEGPTAPPAERK